LFVLRHDISFAHQVGKKNIHYLESIYIWKFAKLRWIDGWSRKQLADHYQRTPDDLQIVENLIHIDPFYREQIADYKTTEFSPTKFDERFRSFLICANWPYFQEMVEVSPLSRV
jgi:hypothetical protein